MTTKGTGYNSMFALWPGNRLNFNIIIKPTFSFAGQHAASEAGHIANTNVGAYFMNGLVEYSNSFSFTVDQDENLAQEAVQVLWDRIKAFKPRTIRRTTDKIFYTAGVMRLVLNVNLLYGISEGEIKVEKKDQTLIVHYVIRFYESFALSVIPAVGALVIGDSIIEKVIGFLLVVFVSYGGNVLTTIFRYKRFIKNTIADWLEEKKPISISELQKEWMGNPNKCDACGYVLSLTERVCSDCGLRLR